MVSYLSLLSSVSSFLEHCSQSSGHAFEAFTELLASLKSPDTQLTTRKFFAGLYQAWLAKAPEEEYYFSFVTQEVKTYNGDRRKLLLLLFPSIFAPEEWSFTFYEGLLRYPSEEFYSRRVVELGCGSGWITLAIALNSLPKAIYGVDLNPRAIVCSQLNLYLNALDDSGQPIVDSEQKTLMERVKFAESDLLAYFADYDRPLDRIVGCIPQVLNPELEVMQNLVHQGSNDEFLHSLSNYCEKQGYVEDQFGLGLLAKAIEQSIQLLRPTGKVILNFGGRPGASVLERLMTRRGLEIRFIWQTKVEQDPDTDISSLVEIEEATGHRFEFFMTPRSNVPISAATAQIYSQNGGKIYHSVSVYEGVLAYPSWLKQIFDVLQQPNLQEVKSALDLTENDADVAEERFYWLASLFSYLATNRHFPYGMTPGEREFRDRIATYFGNYHSIFWQPDELIITPSRKEIVANLLAIYEPQLVSIDRGLKDLLPIDWQSRSQQQVIEAPRRIPLTCKLMTQLKPSIVITGLKDFELKAEEAFESLVNTAQEIGALLVVDISDNFNLSSQPLSNGLFEYLANRGLPNNVILLVDLIKNRLYPDLSLCIGAVTNQTICKDLVRAAELTYSRVSLIAQFFYQQLLEQLLHFQTTRLRSEKNHLIETSPPNFALQRSQNVTQAFTHPAIQENELPFTESTIRLDYGENCLPSPQTLNRAIAESFARQEITPEECQVHKPLSALFSQRHNINYAGCGNFTYGSGVASLFSAVVQQCRQSQGTFIFPQGAYGYFRATLDFYGVPVTIAPGNEATGFKLDLSALEKILQTTTNPWLYLNAPISNPTGALYSSQELKAIAYLAWQYKAVIILDTIFSGLEFAPQKTKIDLSWLQDRRQKIEGNLILLGGISKEFSASGIRFGYLYSPRQTMVEKVAKFISHPLPKTTMYAMSRFFESLVNGDIELVEHQKSQSQTLHQRAKQLTKVLQESGWQPIIPEGGLFLVAKPLPSLIANQNITNNDSITDLLFDRVGLTINSATWTGLPNYCRFVLSVSETEFQSALIRIRQFFRK